MQQTSVQSRTDEKRDRELWRKTQILKASSLFVGTTDNAPLVEKQAIFLALIGLKPVSEASSGHWVPRPGGRRSVYDDPAAVGALLDSLGLVYRLRHDEYATDALVALQPDSLAAYTAAAAEDDQLKIGELFGYPAMAAAAFATLEDGSDNAGALLSIADQERIERPAGIPDGMPTFRFSAADWRRELLTEQLWLTALRLYDLVEP